MSRRRCEKKRIPQPDAIYNDVLISKFINCVMRCGKKLLAQRIVYDAIKEFAKDVNEKDVVKAVEQAIENVKPNLQIKSRKVGGSTYQVPVEIAMDKQVFLALKWIIMHSKKKSGKNMKQGLVMELVDSYHNKGASVKKKEDMHRMAEANLAFSYFK